ncbi:uncharacterized protein PF11_0213 isoform X2 [Copidosoma floridanum]|uniref:uncharacterized protein PF11_0213 isoform X2 n=1 Tax=Copidosoma floridanum TaxID=29053 RepID=UPI0006C994FE|nr:uncharacterized protein PF11_0213 isoform X2 [Copidosoma floridanum]
MTEPGSQTKPDNFEDTSSSGDWTFVDQTANVKEINNSAEEEIRKKDLNEPESPVVLQETKTEVVKKDEEQKENIDEEQVEKGIEAGEKDTESDDVSVISDEEPDHTISTEKRIEKLDLNQLRESSSQPESDNCCGIDAIRPFIPVLLGGFALLIASLILIVSYAFIEYKFQQLDNQDLQYQCAFESLGKLKPASEFTENLQNLDHVASSLDDINYKMPEIKNLVDDLSKNVNNFMNVKISLEHALKHVNYKIELVAALYESYCAINGKMNGFRNKMCKTPRALHDMISFKKKWTANNGIGKIPKENQDEFLNALNEDKHEIDTVAETLLSEFLNAYSKFANNVEELQEMTFRSKSLTNKGNIYNKEKNWAKKGNDSSEKEETGEKSKGELKNDWKKNKSESKEKQSSEEKKYDKRDKNENYKKYNNKNSKHKREYDDSGESNERDFDKKYENKRNGDYVQKHEYEKKNRNADHQSPKKKNDDHNEKKDWNSEHKSNKNKKEYDYERKFENNKKVPDYENKSDSEKNFSERDFENSNKKENFYQERDDKKYCESGHKCNKKRYRDDDDDDDDDDDHRLHRHQHYSYKDHPKRYVDSDETRDKYFNENYGDREREKRNGEWLMERFAPVDEDGGGTAHEQ